MTVPVISDDIRIKVLGKIREVCLGLHLENSAEAIEKSCYDKSNSNIELYRKACNEYLEEMKEQRRNTQMNQNTIPVAQLYRPNNAQANQTNNQQSNVQQQMNNRFNTTMYPGNIQQRAMMSGTLQAGSMQRPMEQQFQLSHSPNTINMQPQIHQVHNINSNTIRLIHQSPQNTQRQIYHIDGTGNIVSNHNIHGQQVPGQQMQGQPIHGLQMQNQIQSNPQMQIPYRTNPQIQVQRMQSTSLQGQRIQGQIIPNQHGPQIQVQRVMQGQQGLRIQGMHNQHIVGQPAQVISQPINVQQISIPRMVNQQAQDQNISTSQNIVQPISTQQSTISVTQLVRTMSNSTPTVAAAPPPVVKVTQVTPSITISSGTTKQNSVPPSEQTSTTQKTIQNPPVTTTKVSEEEAIKVQKELEQMAEQYLKYIVLVIENPQFLDDQKFLKIFVTIKSVIVDRTSPSRRVVTLQHIEKIKPLCLKAEKIAIDNRLGMPKQNSFRTSEELFGKRILAEKTCTASTVYDYNLNPKASAPSTLDEAFDDLRSKISSLDPKLVKKNQNDLVLFARSNQKYRQYLPKMLQNPEDDNASDKAAYDDHEFDYLDDIEFEGIERPLNKENNCIFDHDGLLRTDIDGSMFSSLNFDGVQSEIDLSHGEFDIVGIDEQIRTESWFTRDIYWEGSLFFAVTYRNESLPAQVPALFLRVPEDYETVGSVDWNINNESYRVPCHSSNGAIFLGDVFDALEYAFVGLQTVQLLTTVSLLHALSVYKRSIETGLSNYKCRRSLL